MDDVVAGSMAVPRPAGAARAACFEPPNGAWAVPRPRLVAELRRRMGDTTVWLQGGPGWGKSFIAAELMRDWDGPAAWWRLGEPDGAGSGFEQGLAAACGPILAEAPAAAPRGAPVRELLSRVEPGSLLVVDGVERVLRRGGAPLIATLVEERPTGLSLLLTCRGTLPASLVRLAATPALTVFSPSAAAFDETESLAVARLLGLRDDALAVALHRDAEGWPAAFVLMVRRVLAGGSGDLREEAAAACLDYVLGEVLAAAPAEGIDALARFAGRERLSEGDLLQKSGGDSAVAALEALHAAGAPVNRRWQRADGGAIEPVYRMHPLLALALGRRARAAPVASSPAPELRFSLQVMGGFAVLVDGEPVRYGRKAPARLLELLKCLLTHGGRGVDVERIAQAVWPEAEGDAAMRSFTSALHRLRRLLGRDDVLVLRDNKLSLDDALCEVDLWRLHEAFERIDTDRCGAVSGDVDGILACAEALLDAYRGPFLAQEGARPEYALARDRLRGRFLRHLGRLAEALEGLGRWTEAADLYRRGIEVEPEAVLLHERLARCHREPAVALAAAARGGARRMPA